MNPFLPYKKPRFAIVDYRADKEIIKNIEKMNIEIIKTIKCKELQEPVMGHPDMILHPVTYDTLILAPNVYDYYHNKLGDNGIKIIKGEKTLSRNHPEDIAYNVARIGKYAFHNIKYTDPKLRYYLEKNGIELIHVNQGYSKCSIAIVDDNKIITTDIGIHEKAVSKGINSIYIEPNIVDLPGYDYGFIGGAAGRISKDEFLITGIIENKVLKRKIHNFISDKGFTISYASEKRIIDLGTIIPIM